MCRLLFGNFQVNIYLHFINSFSGLKMDILLRIAMALALCLPISGNILMPPDMAQGL